MSAATLPRDLLSQAHHLLSREAKRPKQASLRRAISAAYYAVFHLLGSDMARLLAPNVEESTRHLIRRWLDHGEMRVVCGNFAKPLEANQYKDLLDGTGNADLQTVAASFISLQGARHDADYDLSITYTRAEATALLQQASDCFAAWGRIKKSSDANVFLLTLLMRKQWDKLRER